MSLYGAAVTWFALFFLEVYARESPRLNKLSVPDHLSIESRARLLCGVSSGDQPIEFRWLKDGIPFASSGIEHLDQWTSTLTLYPLSLDHIGNYTCVASNAVGTSQSTASLFVTAPPHWVVEPFDIKVRRREKAVFHCEARGSPEVKIQWKRISDFDEVLPLPGGSRVYGNGSLVIPDTEQSEGGSYLCQVGNGVGGGLEKRVSLTVYEFPSVERLVDHVTVERGQVGRLSCIARGDPPLHFTWLKNGQRLDETTGTFKRSNVTQHVAMEHVEFSLSLSQTEPEDEGLYTCVATNDHGSDKRDVRLMLVERPHAPLGVEVVDVWSRSARIRWSPPNNGNSPIVSYTLEYWANPGGPWTETVSHPSCTLRGLRPSVQYHFQVWATNDLGDSEPSQQSHFTTAKEEPSSPPLDFKMEDIGSTFVRLSWKPPPREEWNGDLIGYYVGYKRSNSRFPFTYNTVEVEGDGVHHYVLRGLRKGTAYQLIVRTFNEVGSGPATEEILVKTSNREPPPQPILVVKDIGSTYLQIQWILPEDARTNTAGWIVHFRRSGERWSEISIPDAHQNSYTLTNLDPGHPYQIYVTSHGPTGISEPSEIATVRTSAETLFHNVPKSVVESEAVVDDVTQILYIVVPVAVATVIIVVVIVVACVYVYSKRPLPPSHPYGDLPVSKNFSYMSTMPRQCEGVVVPIGMCGGMKYASSPYSTVPLTRPEQYTEDEEPIYESVMDEIRFKMNPKPYEDELKLGTATVV